jgi:hypothetical protein
MEPGSMSAPSQNRRIGPNHQKVGRQPFVYKVHSQRVVQPRVSQSHSRHSGESFPSCHPLSWSKFAMRSRRYPKAKMSTRTAGWCAYLRPRSCHNVPTLFRSMWCNTNWGDLLQPAPLSIALLGSLMVIASSTNDFCLSLSSKHQ